MEFILDFEKLIKEVQEFEGVSRKSSIDNVINLLSESYNVSGDVVIDIGDDASAIDIGDNQVILVAADGIWGQIMNVNPYWAGYCSVLVNVNDIAAMGGKPLAIWDGAVFFSVTSPAPSQAPSVTLVPPTSRMS